VKIALDAGGQNNDLRPLIEGARLAAADGLEIVLFGPQDELEAALRPQGNHSFAIVDSRFIDLHDVDLQTACRENPDASIMRAAEAVAGGQVQAMVSACPPACLAAAGTWHMKRLPGVLKPALVATIPTAQGPKLLLDAGAQAECKPWHLLQFAVMGSIYAQKILHIEAPQVGFLTAGNMVGSTETTRETLPLLKYGGIEFAGVATGKDLARGNMDVFVCDGATGDTALKLHSGLAHSIFEMLESNLQSSPIRKVGGVLAKGALSGAKECSYGADSGGAPLLGLGGPAVACLGPRSADATKDALGCAANLAASDVHQRIRDRLVDMKSDMEFARVRN
jgi:glycerol-3-phosphate acyltransferase PlsX